MPKLRAASSAALITLLSAVAIFGPVSAAGAAENGSSLSRAMSIVTGMFPRENSGKLPDQATIDEETAQAAADARAKAERDIQEAAAAAALAEAAKKAEADKAAAEKEKADKEAAEKAAADAERAAAESASTATPTSTSPPSSPGPSVSPAADSPVISSVAAPGSTLRTSGSVSPTGSAAVAPVAEDLQTLALPASPSVGEASSQKAATTDGTPASARQVITTTASDNQMSMGALLALAALFVVGALVLLVARLVLRMRQRRDRESASTSWNGTGDGSGAAAGPALLLPASRTEAATSTSQGTDYVQVLDDYFESAAETGTVDQDDFDREFEDVIKRAR